MTFARVLLVASAGAALPVIACVVSFESGPRDDQGTDAGADAPPDAMPLADVNLPPPPPTCKREGLVCIPAAPEGWSGPFALYAGGAPSAPTCAAGTTAVLQANDSLAPSPPAECSACACAPATGWSCANVRVHGNSSSCNCALGSTVDIPPNTCTSISAGSLICGGFQANGISFDPASATNGVCSPLTKRPPAKLEPVQWNVAAVGCQLSLPSRVDCPEGNVCGAVPAPPFNPKQCIMKAGDVPACPGFPYAKRSIFYRGIEDTRACAECACGAAPKAACATTVTTSAAADCSGSAFVPAPACLQLAGQPYVRANTVPPPDVQCPPSGGAPIGAVAVADAVTVCCAE